MTSTTTGRTKRSARCHQPAVTAPRRGLTRAASRSRGTTPSTGRPNGEIKWGGDLVFLGDALPGEPIGIAETEPGDWLVRFADGDLGIIDRKTKRLRRFMAGRPACHKAKPEQTEESVRHVSGL